jgi:hypothetical protein
MVAPFIQVACQFKLHCGTLMASLAGGDLPLVSVGSRTSYSVWVSIGYLSRRTILWTSLPS